jgi:hypothetical protein
MGATPPAGASTQPPLGLSERQLTEAQNHADYMQTLENKLIEQNLMKEIAINRKEIANTNLNSAMIEEQEKIIQSYPFEYMNELKAFNFPESEPLEPQKSIDISDQQPAEKTEEIEQPTDKTEQIAK